MGMTTNGHLMVGLHPFYDLFFNLCLFFEVLGWACWISNAK